MLEKGDLFPTKEERTRIDLQTQWEQMFHGVYHYRKIIDQTGKPQKVDPLVPIPAAISEITADLLFGEFPIMDFQNESTQKIYAEFINTNFDFMTDILEAATYNSPLGTVFWYNYKLSGMNLYEFVRSNRATWTNTKLGLINVKFFEIDKVEKNKRIIWYKIQEHRFEYDETFINPYLDPDRKYVIDNYKIKVNILKDNEIVLISDYKKEPTDYDFIPIIKIDNLRQMGVELGKSDYQGKEQMFAEIDNRVDQINYVLQEHAEPWVALPPIMQNNNQVFDKSLGKMYQKIPGNVDSQVSIASWDAQLESAFKQIEQMVFLVFFTSRISMPIAGLDKGGNVDSGRALKWRSINTTAMINRKRKYWNEAFKKFFEIQVRLNDDWSNVDVSKLSVQWKDGLPLDDTEVTETVVAKVSAGIQSHLKGIMEVQEIDKDKATKELDQIKTEQQDKATIESSKFRGEV